MSDPPTTPAELARANWNTDREALGPSWQMPVWSKAPAWQRRPYLLAAQEGKHPDE